MYMERRRQNRVPAAHVEHGTVTPFGRYRGVLLFRPIPVLMSTTASFSMRAEEARKALHLLALSIPLGMDGLGMPVAGWIVTSGALLGILGDVLRVRWAPFRAFITRWFGPLMRPSEWPPLGGSVVLNGATSVLIACAGAAWLFPLDVAVPVLCAALVADAAAALVGRRVGRHAWGAHGRTVEGSLAFVVVAVAVFGVFGLPWMALLIAAGAGAVLEALPLPVNDNIVVPLGMALVLVVMV